MPFASVRRHSLAMLDIEKTAEGFPTSGSAVVDYEEAPVVLHP